MDEVDIDNVEDINELEARLYSQIHHEATDGQNGEINVQFPENNSRTAAGNDKNSGNREQDCENSLNGDTILRRRYWASVKTPIKLCQQDKTLQFNQHLIRNPFKAANDNKTRNISQSKLLQNACDDLLKGNKNVRKTPSIYKSHTEEPTSYSCAEGVIRWAPETDSQDVELLPSSNYNTRNSKDGNAVQNIAKRKLLTKKSNLKLNPLADWMKQKKNLINKKENSKRNNVSAKSSTNFSTNIKQGPFARQHQKLERAKRVEEKKHKTKKGKNSITAISNIVESTEVINLDSDNESSSSDIIIMPIAPALTVTIDDSSDEDNHIPITMGHEENALDSTDVEISSNSVSFIKPQEINTQCIAAAENVGKRLENSSRCTSPSSIQSSDDFIGQTDRSRLVAGSSGMADDEDLLVLTSDINSLLEVPDIQKQGDKNFCFEKGGNPLGSKKRQGQGESVETNNSLEFATPKTTKHQSPKDYRVDQSQFSALDVYESESDITDSVYSKGANKLTVIRQINSSSDEVEDISSCNQRTKRLRKRRASSSNKESDPNNEHLVSSSDDENEEDDIKSLRTSIPFISKGPAVESYKPRKPRRTLSSCSPILQKRKSANVARATDYMSDTEFIATLNNLAQGQESEKDTQILEDVDLSETENTPTAREIAEKILAEHNTNKGVNKFIEDDVALPNNILNELDSVFETIDHFDGTDTNRLTMMDDTVKISDSSDSDREKHFIYKSLSDQEAQIIKYSPNTSKKYKSPASKNFENSSPIYNTIYCRGSRKPGGIGWNEEMRKFYNESWNGEQFISIRILQKMNPDKNLWKIYTEDRFNIKPNKRNIKCMNCYEFGHMRSKCKRPKKPIICYMCGESGHFEPRCPNTICLRCGNKTQVFTKSCNACIYQNHLTCPLCKIRGHSLDYCPDKWRRYHSTTEPNVQPFSSIDYNPRKYCCVCGSRGHISDNCRSAVRFLEYPAIESTIKSHQKSYTDIVIRTPHNGIAMNLMYEPWQEYKFDLVEQTSPDKYYGRFLKAVGMDYLFKRKRQNTLSIEIADSYAKRTKRLSQKYEANPYLKVGTANKKDGENAPNQVQEISESGNTDQQSYERHLEEDFIHIENKGDDKVKSSDRLIEKADVENIQLNTVNKSQNEAERQDQKFKSPKNITSTSVETSLRSLTEPALIDSDSNYSFSEHFDVASSSQISTETPTKISNIQRHVKGSLTTTISASKTQKTDILPDFIPLTSSTQDQNEQQKYDQNLVIGISRRFVAADSDNDDETGENDRNLSPLPELPCEAKIYLTNFHSKYLLSPPGNAFLIKTSRAHKLKARLNFTSIGHVLIIFGLPTNQNKFQTQLLLKYRELEDERNRKQLHSNLSVPKRTYVLIRFLRDNIIQLMSNLGNANHLLSHLQFLERQHTKSSYKLAEKVRRSLNMILVGQAGLQNGTLHLDKLLLSLKTLLNDVISDVAPPELRAEIMDHWKVIFSAYRHENYQKLVDTYNKLVTKNRMPQLNIDPVLLGQKVLDTSFTEEQKRKLDQTRTSELTNASVIKTESSKQATSSNQKNTKLLKRKQNAATSDTSIISAISTATTYKTKPTSSPSETPPNNVSQTIITTAQADSSISSSNVKANSSSLFKSCKTHGSASIPGKSKTLPVNQSKCSTITINQTLSSATANITENYKKRQQNVVPSSSFSTPEKGKYVSATIQKVTDKWKSTCDTLLTEITSEKPNKNVDGGRSRESRLPSTFWSRESIRYLDDCARLAVGRPQIIEKIQRVQYKSKNGQLSYNDYLAVIKLHTAFNGK